MPWLQVYDPFRALWLSALFAALPVTVWLVALGLLRIRAHWAALLGLVTAVLVALTIDGMPVSMAGRAAIYGALYGLVPHRLDPRQCMFLLPVDRRYGR
jgi:lactate permease